MALDRLVRLNVAAYGIQSGNAGNFYRIVLPSQKRCCAPCSPNHNLCCEPCIPAKITPTGTLEWPEHEVLRQRISIKEWEFFIACLDAADRLAAVPCHFCCLVPLTIPCIVFQPCCCFVPFQYMHKGAAESLTNTYQMLAKFNRYLFMPRGLLIRYQREEAGSDDSTINLFRIEIMPTAAPVQQEMLGPGMALGTMPGDYYTDAMPFTSLPCCFMVPKVNNYLRASEWETRDDPLEDALQKLR